MKAAELLKIGAKILETLSKCDIKISDYKYLPLYSDFEEMERAGEKTTYIVAILSERYKLGEASVWRILKRFKHTI